MFLIPKLISRYGINNELGVELECGSSFDPITIRWNFVFFFFQFFPLFSFFSFFLYFSTLPHVSPVQSSEKADPDRQRIHDRIADKQSVYRADKIDKREHVDRELLFSPRGEFQFPDGSGLI